MHSLLYQRVLLDDLVLEFEGQHVQYVNLAVIRSEQEMERVSAEADGRDAR